MREYLLIRSKRKTVALAIKEDGTRWGSCSGKNRLCLSWRLMERPREVIDYVIIHELCHTEHHDHSKGFWALVESFLPNYRALRRELKGW